MAEFQEYPKAVGPNRDLLARDAEHEARLLATLAPSHDVNQEPMTEGADVAPAAVSVAKLAELVAMMDDIAALMACRDAEVAGKNRNGALKLIDARLAALAPITSASE